MLILRVGSQPIDRPAEAIEGLRQRGFRSDQAGTGGDALNSLRRHDYDLALVDLLLPDMTGEEVVRMARDAGVTTPVIITATASTPATRVKVLDLGADDFVTIPCDIDELTARIRAIVRRRQGHAQSILAVGCVELDLNQREIRVRGQKLLVSRREFSVMELLFLKQDTVLSKAALVSHMYRGGEEPDIKSIDVIICRLRKKLAEIGVGTLINTIWGCGYALRDPLSPVEPTSLEPTSLGPLQLVA